jgi:hypothetical protein
MTGSLAMAGAVADGAAGAVPDSGDDPLPLEQAVINRTQATDRRTKDTCPSLAAAAPERS